MSESDDSIESYLRSLLRATEGDWALTRLGFLADKGLTIGVSVVTAAGLIAGRTGKVEDVAVGIDEVLYATVESSRAWVQQPPDEPSKLASFEGFTEGDFAALKAKFQAGVFLGPTIAQRRAAEQAIQEEIGRREPEGDLPAELREFVADRERPRSVLTLTDAVLTPPRGGAVQFPAPIRVLTRHVIAWWVHPLAASEGAGSDTP
jgi:hypothetical protein